MKLSFGTERSNFQSDTTLTERVYENPEIPPTPWVVFRASDVIPMFPTLVWKIQLKAELHEVIDAKFLRWWKD
jgi:hypothetical protein